MKKLSQVVEEYVDFALDQHRGNVSETARALGIDRATVKRIVNRNPLFAEKQLARKPGTR